MPHSVAVPTKQKFCCLMCIIFSLLSRAFIKSMYNVIMMNIVLYRGKFGASCEVTGDFTRML